MNIELPPNLSDSLRLLVDQGHFVSEQEACVAGLELLLSRERLKIIVDRGRQQVLDGQWSDEEAVFNQVDAEICRAEAESGQGA